MGARNKLNQAHVNGALIWGAAVGLATESWLWSAVIFSLCLACSCYHDGIRSGRRRK